MIVTARKLKLWSRKGLSLSQKINYWSSVVYWYSPIKNLVYMLAPLMYAVFAIPIFRCSWLELLMYWIPMFAMQEFSLRLISGNRTSTKWSGIYETSVMPLLLIPIVKEMFGISLSVFKVTDKSGAGSQNRKRDLRSMVPFLILIGLNVIGIIRICMSFNGLGSFGLVILLSWVIRNLYLLLMAVFLVDGRDHDGEPVHVYDAETLTIQKNGEDRTMDGVSTHLTVHNISFFLDKEDALEIGDPVDLVVMADQARVELSGMVISRNQSASGIRSVYTMEILDFKGMEDDYLQILFDRVPTLPQNLNRDYGILWHLWVNIANRVGRVKG